MAEAKESYLEAICLQQKLVAEFPQEPRFRAELAGAWFSRGFQLAKSGEALKAEKDCRQAAELYEQLRAEFPTDRQFHYGLAGCHNNLGILLQASGRAHEASEEFRKMIEVWCKALEQFPENGEVQNDAAWFLATCPDPTFRDTGRALELAQKAVELAPQAAYLWNTLGVAHYRAGGWRAAIEALQKSEELAPGKYFAFTAFFLGLAHWQLGEKDEARQWYDRAVEWMEKNKPQDEELKRFRAEAEELLGIAQGANRSGEETADAR